MEIMTPTLKRLGLCRWIVYSCLAGGALCVAAGCRPAPVSTDEDSAAVNPDQGLPIDGVPVLEPVLVEVNADLDDESAEAPSARDVAADELAESGQEAAEPDAYETWPKPEVALVVTGQQNGYIEPCGCTGLTRQKGGVARRFTFLSQLRDKGWEVVPVDAGNQVRRYGRQAEIKYHQTVDALRQMDYESVGLGPDDVRLSVGDLIQEAAADDASEAIYVSANVVLIDPSLMPSHKVIERNGFKVAITNLLDPEALKASAGDEIEIRPVIDAAKSALAEMQKQSPDYLVLTFYGDEEAGQELVRQVPGFDLLVLAGGYGEPTYLPQEISGSKTRMIVTGNKGMYAGLVGLYRDQPLKYARVALTHEFKDAAAMRELMASYQDQLRQVGLRGLGLSPVPHPSGEEFVGTEACGECHTTAYDIWSGTGHALATDHIIEPREERGDVPRHFDPECLSCHVTGWHPQDYYPYASGYWSLETSQHLVGNGCENCHGPGRSHVAAERDGSGVSEARRDELRLAMQLPLEKAREHCMQCHDLDNSPDFHEEDAFEDIYWPEVEHYGVD